MGAEQKRRARRNPLSPEEVAEIVALKKRQAHFRLHKLKRSTAYKLLNVFNIACIFVYLELIFCFYGACVFEKKAAKKVQVQYGDVYRAGGERMISDIDIEATDGRTYNFVVRDFRGVPPDNTIFYIGKDYLLRKELKGAFGGEDETYRLFAASPVLFLSVLVMVASFIGFAYDLNENAYSLSAISVLNAFTILGILVM